MKIAISMPDGTFEAATSKEEELGVSRSELITRAVRSYLDRLESESVTAQINRTLARVSAEVDDVTEAVVAAGRRRLLVADDDWRPSMWTQVATSHD